MPTYTVEFTFRVPHYVHQSFTATDDTDAARIANGMLERDEIVWEYQKVDYDCADPVLITGLWDGEPYYAEAIQIPFDNAEALTEGWMLTEREDGRAMIQRDPTQPAFADDFAAFCHVKDKAYGSGYHAEALLRHGSPVAVSDIGLAVMSEALREAAKEQGFDVESGHWPHARKTDDG